MASETVVAVFSTEAHAEAAIADLVAAGVPGTSIEHYARDPADAGAGPETLDADRHGGFWAWMTGHETTEAHHDVYDRSMQSGRTVVTVISDGSNADEIHAVLERHDPVDLDDHATAGTGTGYGGTAATAGVAAAGTAAAVTTTERDGFVDPGFAPRIASPADTTRTGGAGEVISLSEETLEVGKRQVALGTTRIRRFVVERPVEEQIKLRDETVSVFRRPPIGSTVADAFKEREVVVNESSEEAVVAKTAHVVEEVVIQKGVQERVETIHDTVRHEEVEIERPAGYGLDDSRKTDPSV